MSNKFIKKLSEKTWEDEIVISGLAGRFPNSHNVNEFASNLYNKVNMVDDDERRWRHTNPEIPKESGKVYDLEKFDASFFGVNMKQARCMDPQGRMILEHAYEAIIDAGVAPKSLKNSNTGVFVGVCFNESEKIWIYDQLSKEGFGLTGSARTMLANRVSFALGLNGPSFVVDTACSSSMYALDAAFRAISSGECDAALVAGVNLCLQPNLTLQFARLGVLAKTGFCRPFDNDACGYNRSEACGVIFLQKAINARRVYGSLIHSKINCDGFKEEGINFPSHKVQQRLLSEFYNELEINTNTFDLGFIEAHCTSTKVGDPEETKTLDEVFCRKRAQPLWVGSVKSNMGHSESASGICSITKVLIAFQNGKIPPNINFVKPRESIPALIEGRLKVVVDPIELKGDYVCVNSFGFGGANAHALLKRFHKEKYNYGTPFDKIPRLVVWSGRTENAIDSIIECVTGQPLDAELIGLLQISQSDSIPANIYRGYGIFVQNGATENATCVRKGSQHFNGIKLPVVWVYSGMGSQWCSMGNHLMQIPLFAEAIKKCHKILAIRGLNLTEIITSTNPEMFDNILHSFVGIAAIQIGLTDVLKALGLQPDYIIGHSVGELGCAYADGCLSAEEMILSSYSRGMASLETETIYGAMAAVGMGYDKLRLLAPDGIEIACHNSSDSSTISGPSELIASFVAKLKAKNIFAKEVECSNIPYHSGYIKEMGNLLKSKLEKVIKTPRRRSSKWISSSYPESRWNEENAQLSSPEYHTNNLLSPVLFEESSKHLPKNGLIIEIAPHGLLQAILKRSFSNSTNIALTQKSSDNLTFFIEALGKIYSAGFDLQVFSLYPEVKFPVSRGTPSISPFVKWDHRENHFVMKFDNELETKSFQRQIVLSLKDSDHDYINGHIIDGRVLIPATGYLFLAWETFVLSKGCLLLDNNVEFEDLKFIRATSFSLNRDVELTIVIHPGTGKFEISEKLTAVMTGTIRFVNNVKFSDTNSFGRPGKLDMMSTRDFYKELRLRGYHYQGLFKSVQESSFDGRFAKIRWESNWIAFLDCMLQSQILGSDTRALSLPTSIQKVKINPNEHIKTVRQFSEENAVLDVFYSPELKTIQCAGVEINNMKVSIVGRRNVMGDPVLEIYTFVPYFTEAVFSSRNALKIIIQLAQENIPKKNIKIVEIEALHSNLIIDTIGSVLEEIPLVTWKLILISSRTNMVIENVEMNSMLNSQTECYLIISMNSIDDSNFLEEASSSFSDDGFLVCREDSKKKFNGLKLPSEYTIISAIKSSNNETLWMLKFNRKKPEYSEYSTIITSKDNHDWIKIAKHSIQKKTRSVFVSCNEPTSGIIGLVNCIRKEPERLNVTAVFIDDQCAPTFDVSNYFYSKQMQLGLAINIYKNGNWGSYRHLELKSDIKNNATAKHCYINSLVKGDLTSLKWIEGHLNFSKPQNNVVKVQYAALNFRDVMLATGKISATMISKNRFELECVLGIEFSGILSNGRRVTGMLPSNAMATLLVPDDFLILDVPDEWSLAEAATVPVVYGTVYAAFFISARIEKGKSVLVHSGTGGVGMAAIRVAFAYGLEVFTTVSTDQKKKFLLNEFPQMKVENIGNSRDTSFEDLVMIRTNGKGVDYVLNSLADDKLQASIRCLGPKGHFFEIGKFDIENNSKIGLRNFENELSFHSIMLDRVFVRSSETKKSLMKMLSNDINKNIIKPLPTKIFEANQVEQAFRLLASGKHIGKVLLKIREDENDQKSLPISVQPRVYCHSELSYVIPGGLGGFGLELADWLVLRGCRKLVLSSSRGISKQYQSYRIRTWESYGVKVEVNTEDITTKNGCENLIRTAMKLGPVGGVFNLAVQLRDNIFLNQDIEKFVECLAPKAKATQYLDELTRLMCPKLHLFVVFSSVSCGRGNAGQSNYGMANSIMEKIIEQRHQVGLPAKAIQWGAVGEVGLVADMQEDKIDMEISGTLQQRISSCLEVLDILLNLDCPVTSSMVVAEKKMSSVKSGNILEDIMSIMGIRDIKSVSVEATLAEIGMDSLMTVEIQQTLEREYNLMMTPQDLRSITLSKLEQMYSKTKQKISDGIAGNNKVKNLERIVNDLGDEKMSDVLFLPVSGLQKDPSRLYLIIPGIEGIAGESWINLTKNLASNSVILQHKNLENAGTIDSIISLINAEVVGIFDKYEEFLIVGHSLGSIIALKLANILEMRGKSGKLTLIDGSHQFVKRYIFNLIGTHPTDTTFENVMLNSMVEDVVKQQDLHIREIIESKITCNEKIEKIMTVSREFNSYSSNFIKSIVKSMVEKAKLSYYLKLEDFKILHKTDIHLIRPKVSSVKEIEQDYNLSDICMKNVRVSLVDGNHRTILDSDQIIDVLF